MGLHTGEAEQHGGTYFGSAVHLASRLAAVGHGGQTLASEPTALLRVAGSHLDLGRWALDGVTSEVRILQISAGQHPPLLTEDRNRGNIPGRLNRLVGRDQEHGRVVSALASHGLVTLVGPGGIGKTSLALAVARDLAPREGWLVELATIDAPADVPRVVAEVLGVSERQGTELTSRVVEQAWCLLRNALLLLDECEQVVDAVADLAARVLAACPRFASWPRPASGSD